MKLELAQGAPQQLEAGSADGATATASEATATPIEQAEAREPE